MTGIQFKNIMQKVSDHKEVFKDRDIFINSIPGQLLNEPDYDKLMNYRIAILKEQLQLQLKQHSYIPLMNVLHRAHCVHSQIKFL